MHFQYYILSLASAGIDTLVILVQTLLLIGTRYAWLAVVLLILFIIETVAKVLEIQQNL